MIDGNHRRPLSERFWGKVSTGLEDDCWPWTGALDGKGYGQMRINKKNVLATHVSLGLSGKERPCSNSCACHSCDNPICVNPNHLWWGSRKDNHRDAMEKGRLNLSGLSLGHDISRKKGSRWIVPCDSCGIDFQSNGSRVKINKRNFCSRDCSSKWQSENFTGKPRGS